MSKEEKKEEVQDILLDSEEKAITYLKEYMDKNKEKPYTNYEIVKHNNKSKLLNNPYYIWADRPDVQGWGYFVTIDGEIYDSSRCVFTPNSDTCKMPVSSETEASLIVSESNHLAEIQSGFNAEHKIFFLTEERDAIMMSGYAVYAKIDNPARGEGGTETIARYFVSNLGQLFYYDVMNKDALVPTE